MHEEDNLIGHMRNADGTGPLINDAEAVERRAAVRAIARGLPEPATTNPATTPVVEGLGMLAEYAREHFAQLAGVEPMVRRVKAKRKR